MYLRNFSRVNVFPLNDSNIISGVYYPRSDTAHNSIPLLPVSFTYNHIILQ